MLNTFKRRNQAYRRKLKYRSIESDYEDKISAHVQGGEYKQVVENILYRKLLQIIQAKTDQT